MTGAGTPPSSATRNRAPLIFGAKTITPSRFHVPPRGVAASHRVCAGPPARAIFLSLPCAKNPRFRPSGDQNGNVAPSVPGIGRASSESSGRTQRRVGPPSSLTKARLRPSGESIKKFRLDFSGSDTLKRPESWAGGVSRKCRTVGTAIATITTTATASAAIHASRPLGDDMAAAVLGSTRLERAIECQPSFTDVAQSLLWIFVQTAPQQRPHGRRRRGRQRRPLWLLAEDRDDRVSDIRRPGMPAVP